MIEPIIEGSLLDGEVLYDIAEAPTYTESGEEIEGLNELELVMYYKTKPSDPIPITSGQSTDLEFLHWKAKAYKQKIENE